MAFDLDQQRTLLFGGGGDGVVSADTWAWDGNAWTQVEDVGPSPRELHGLGYDAGRKRTVLFGGSGAGGTLGETWEWDATNWTQLQDVGPSPRVGSAMTFDGVRVVLFGGSSAAESPATLFGDTWDWDGHRWTERQDMGPPARWLHAVTFDSARDKLVLFGGTPAVAGEVQLGDTWETAGESGPPATPGDVTLASLAVTRNLYTLSGSIGLTGPAPDGLVVQLRTIPDAGGLVLDTTFESLIAGPPWLVPIAGGATATSFSVSDPERVPGVNQLVAQLGSVVKTSTVTVISTI